MTTVVVRMKLVRNAKYDRGSLDFAMTGYDGKVRNALPHDAPSA